MSNCGDHFGAQCNFTCAIGHRLNGSSTVACVAPGNRPPGVWDNPLPSCQGRTEKTKKYIAEEVKLIHETLRKGRPNLPSSL